MNYHGRTSRGTTHTQHHFNTAGGAPGHAGRIAVPRVTRAARRRTADTPPCCPAPPHESRAANAAMPGLRARRARRLGVGRDDDEVAAAAPLDGAHLVRVRVGFGCSLAEGTLEFVNLVRFCHSLHKVVSQPSRLRAAYGQRAYFRLAASFRKFAPRACIFSHTIQTSVCSGPRVSGCTRACRY